MLGVTWENCYDCGCCPNTAPEFTHATDRSQCACRWKPLNAIDRRVLGVLVEKAKTTPDQYPLSLNALLTGCNQKSNRHPVLNLDDGDVIMSVDRLRMMGVVAEVQGGGRVPRYRHYANEWLGVERAELSIMTELLLRGSQTEGELRTRVARMDEMPTSKLCASTWSICSRAAWCNR